MILDVICDMRHTSIEMKNINKMRRRTKKELERGKGTEWVQRGEKEERERC